MGALTFSDAVPYLKWLDYLKGTKKACERTGRGMDTVLKSWLEQHKKLQKMKTVNGLQQLDGEKNFMEVIMAAADSIAHQFTRYDADTIIKATCQTMILGGTDTVTVTLVWSLCLLLNNRRVLERAQQELDIYSHWQIKNGGKIRYWKFSVHPIKP